MADSQKLLQSLSDEFQSLQKGRCSAPMLHQFSSYPVTDLSTVVEARQKLESQLQENQSVQKVLTERSACLSGPELMFRPL